MENNEKKTWVFADASLNENYDVMAEFTSEEMRNLNAMLVLEEAFMNIITHAYEGIGKISKPCMVTVEKKDGKTIITVDDVGSEFDPTQFVQQADGNSVGGHGIQVIREYSSSMEYSRKMDHNLLKICI